MLASTFPNIWLGGTSSFPFVADFCSCAGENSDPQIKLAGGNPVPKALKQPQHTTQEMRVTFPAVCTPTLALQDLPCAATKDRASTKKQEA